MSKWEEYERALKDLRSAEEWKGLPGGPSYKDSDFEISMEHCTLTLTRKGQQYMSGQNYWNAPPQLTSAVLKVIVDDPSIINRAISLMQKDATLKLIASETEVIEQLAMIEEARNDLLKETTT